jgi:hypothetical protein
MTAEPGDLFNACEYPLDRRVKAGEGSRLEHDYSPSARSNRPVW